MTQFIVEPFNVVYRGKEDCHKAIKLSTIFLLSYDSFAMTRFSQHYKKGEKMKSNKNYVYHIAKPYYNSGVVSEREMNDNVIVRWNLHNKIALCFFLLIRPSFIS